MILAITQWPEAAVAVAGILLVTAVSCVGPWQAFATGRTGMAAKGDRAYRKLAEEMHEAQLRTAEAVERTAADVAELRERTTELERMLKEVE